MGEWVLILLVMVAAGSGQATVSSVPFHDKAACEVAKDKFEGKQGALMVAADCFPTRGETY